LAIKPTRQENPVQGIPLQLDTSSNNANERFNALTRNITYSEAPLRARVLADI